jgi:hypothetical protein
MSVVPYVLTQELAPVVELVTSVTGRTWVWTISRVVLFALFGLIARGILYVWQWWRTPSDVELIASAHDEFLDGYNGDPRRGHNYAESRVTLEIASRIALRLGYQPDNRLNRAAAWREGMDVLRRETEEGGMGGDATRSPTEPPHLGCDSLLHPEFNGAQRDPH